MQAQLDKLDAVLADVPDAETVWQVALHVQEICGSILVEDDEANTYAGGNDVQSSLLMDDADRRPLRMIQMRGLWRCQAIHR